jgi:hypothetical protein
VNQIQKLELQKNTEEAIENAHSNLFEYIGQDNPTKSDQKGTST